MTFFSLPFQFFNTDACDPEIEHEEKINLAIQWRIVRSIVRPWGIEREAMKLRKRLWRHGERNRKREKRWRHGETNRKRERQFWYTEKEEIAFLFLSLRLEFIHHFDFTSERSRRRKMIPTSASRTKKVPSAYKQRLWWVLLFFWFFSR